MTNGFRGPCRTEVVVGRREDRLVARPLGTGGDFARVRRDDQAVTHASFVCPSRGPEDERLTRQRQGQLAGKAAGTEPRRDHAEDGHGATYKIRAVESSPGLILSCNAS